MSKKTKIWLVMATLLVVIGCIVFGGVMTKLKWDFEKLSTSKYETNKYEISESYKNIQIVTSAANVIFEVADDSKTSVVCYEEENVKHLVEVKDDALVIEVKDTRKWYEHVGINFGNPQIKISIPKREYGALAIKLNTGDVKMSEDFEFESVEISGSTGNLSVAGVSTGVLDLAVSTGAIKVSDVTCAGNIKIKVSTGKTSMTNVECKNMASSGNTGNMVLKGVKVAETMFVERSTGDVKFEQCDAKDISVVTDTGNVSGSLLSPKVFITKTDTGKIEVPKTTTGGNCEISTDTGDIKITIQK